MSLRASHSFTSKHDAARVLQEAQAYFMVKCDYRAPETPAEAPAGTRVFRRGKNALGSWMGYKIQDTPTVLTLQVAAADGQTLVSCVCEVDISRRTPMRGDKDFLFGELQKFEQRLARL